MTSLNDSNSLVCIFKKYARTIFSFCLTSHFPVFLVALKTLFLTFDVQYLSPQGVCELVKEVKQVLINYDNGQHVVEGVQRDGRRGGKKDIGMALQKR